MRWQMVRLASLCAPAFANATPAIASTISKPTGAFMLPPFESPLFHYYSTNAGSDFARRPVLGRQPARRFTFCERSLTVGARGIEVESADHGRRSEASLGDAEPMERRREGRKPEPMLVCDRSAY